MSDAARLAPARTRKGHLKEPPRWDWHGLTDVELRAIATALES